MNRGEDAQLSILVAEGPSASGKTTWCREHFPQGFVEETAETMQAPSPYAEPREAAAFWVERNIQRWQAALELEKRASIAVCDSDPLKLYFSWALWKAGAQDSTLFEIEAPLYRKAIEERRIGFADCVVWLEAPADELRRRAKADATRQRKRHELYLEMVPWMNAWFGARERVLPGCAREWSAAPRLRELEGVPSNPRRYDATVLDELLAVCGWR
jgi:hypothetical protein